MAVRFQLRRDTAANWASINPTLTLGEPGVETDTLKLKIGDGLTAWNVLNYSTSLDFSDFQNLPTTLVGYGITDAATSAQGALANTALQAANLIGYATETFVGTAVSNLINAAPTTLNTLNELATALGNDPNYATTITTALGLKANTASLASVATTGTFASLLSKPTTLVGYGITNAATSAQGAKADTALQSLTFANLLSKPTTLVGYGITDAATSAQGALASTALQSLAFSGLTSKPTTLTGYGITDAATSTQGTKADTAYGWGNHATFGYLTSAPSSLAAILALGNSSALGIDVGDSDIGNFNLTGSVIDTSDSSAITVTPAVNFSTQITVSDVVPSIDSAIDIGSSTNQFRAIYADNFNTGSTGSVNAANIRIGPDANYTPRIYAPTTTTWSWDTNGVMDPGYIFHDRLDSYVRWKSTSQSVYNHINPTGTVDVNFLVSDTHYFFQPAGALTVNFTSIPDTASRMINMRIYIAQGTTGYLPTTVKVNGGAPITVRWQNGVVPTPTTAGNIDFIQYLVWSFGSSNYVILAQSNMYS